MQFGRFRDDHQHVALLQGLIGIDGHVNALFVLEGHHIHTVLFAQVEFDEAFAHPFGLHLHLDEGYLPRQLDHIHKAGGQQILSQSHTRLALGDNHLIRTHKAQLVCTASDIIEALQWDLGEDPSLFREKPPTEQLTKDEAGLLACFRSTDPLSIEELVDLTGLDAGTLTALLVGLELAGQIRLVPGNRYMKPCD